MIQLDPRIVEGRAVTVIARNDETGAVFGRSQGVFRGFQGEPSVMPTLLVERDGVVSAIDTFTSEDWGMDGDEFYVVSYSE